MFATLPYSPQMSSWSENAAFWTSYGDLRLLESRPISPTPAEASSSRMALSLCDVSGDHSDAVHGWTP